MKFEPKRSFEEFLRFEAERPEVTARIYGQTKVEEWRAREDYEYKLNEMKGALEAKKARKEIEEQTPIVCPNELLKLRNMALKKAEEILSSPKISQPVVTFVAAILGGDIEYMKQYGKLKADKDQGQDLRGVIKLAYNLDDSINKYSEEEKAAKVAEFKKRAIQGH